MATMNVKDAAGSVTAVEKPNANGRAAAAASRPVALSTEDKAALDLQATAAKQDTAQASLTAILAKIIAAPATEATSAAILAKLIAAPATAAKQDEATAAINALVGSEYEAVAASSADQVLGATGAIGDLLVGLLITPTTTSPGAVSIKDGSGGAAITIFAGGAASISTLHPFFIPLGIRALSAGWRVTTGAGLTALPVGNFT